jgi:hypothetical protein
MQTPDARIAFIVHGVLGRALQDAGLASVKFVGCEQRQRELVLSWCDVVHEKDAGGALLVSAANKTELLLGEPPRADVYPLGDLYASDIAQLCGSYELGAAARELADRAGGIGELDRALRGLLEERREPEQAFAHIGNVRDDVLQRLEDNRFRLTHLGVVPKIGARTIGIDLFI